MKTKTILFVSFLLGLFATEAFAQNENKLTIPTVEGRLGKELSIPVSMTNDDEIRGVQVTLHFPEDLQVNLDAVALSDRKNGHTITARASGNGDYLFIIFSSTNQAFKGNSGVVFDVPVTIPLNWEENSVHPLQFKQVILSSAQGENLATASDPGAIRVISEERPDIEVQNVVSGKNAVSPGEPLNISWSVKNVGDLATAAGWSEQVFLIDDNEKQTFLATVHYTGTLNPGTSANRQVEVALSQLPGIEGNVKIQVRAVPNAGLGELPSAQANNTAQSAQYLTVNKNLVLELPTVAIPENTSSAVQCKLSRSGDWTEGQVFTLQSSDASRVSLPASVDIPAGQSGAYFYATIKDNTVLDGDSIVSITIVAGNGYASVAGNLIIADDELPALSVAASKTELNEGEEFTLTIERELIGASDLVVYLTSDHASRFEMPAQAIIPAGQKTVNVTLKVKDDNIPDIDKTVEFTVTAPAHLSGKGSLVLHDDDMPEFSLTLTPETVNESAGPLAVKAVLRRLTHTDGNITVNLSDDAAGTLYYSSNKLTLNKGVEEVSFSIGVVDNILVDGQREFNITAAVYISSCGCSAQGTSAGVVHAKLTLLDDDGPALKIVSSQTMLSEGKNDAAILTITKNTPPDEALTLTLSSDRDNELEYEKTVTIPAGSVSVEIPVSVKSNTESEGDRTVVFTASADNYTKGVCWVMITDQTLPDAEIVSLVPAETEISAGGLVNIALTVANNGAATLPANVPINLYLGSQTSPFATVYTKTIIAVNGSEVISESLTLPDVTGNQTLYATINENLNIKELLYLNNKSEVVAIRMLPKFTSTLSVDKTVYKRGETVVFSGKLTGNDIAGAKVEIYLINADLRQTLEAGTDASGNFSVEYQPSVFLSGHFIAGACYPGEGLTSEQATFDIYGLKRENTAYITHDVLVDEPHNDAVRLTNTGVLALHNVRAEIISEADNYQMSFEPIAVLGGNETLPLNYILTGSAVTEGKDWQQIKVRILSDESELLEITIYAFFRLAQGQLTADISSINTTMTKGVSRDYPITITNGGKGETGKISLSLPANATWLSAITPREMAALNPGESATIVLRFTPDNLPLNVIIRGTIGVNCENGRGLPIDFAIEPVSEATGTLVIDVCDEYTYYTEEAPHLAGAKVLIKHPTTNALIAEGITGSDGLFTVNDLLEGYYAIEVSAEKHDQYKNNILVDPGRVTRKVVNLSFQAITINWDVVETTVEDEYDITTTVEYETNVPVPVVIVEGIPEKLPIEDIIAGGSYMFNVVITNKGLITAKDVTLNFPNNPVLQYEYPSMDNLSLRPQESTILPVKVSLKNGQPNPAPSLRASTSGIDDLPCYDGFIVFYAWECGLDRKWHQYEVGRITFKVCPGTPGGGGPWFPDGPSLPGGGGNGGGYGPWDWWEWPKIEDYGCNPCQNELPLKIIECRIGFLPIYGCIYGAGKCVGDAARGKKMTGWDNAACSLTALGCATELCSTITVSTIVGAPISIPCKIVGWIINGINCVVSFIAPCNSGALRSSQQSEYPSYILEFQNKMSYALEELEAYQNILLENYGSGKWLECSNDEVSTLISYIISSKTGDYIDISDAKLIELKPNLITDEELNQFIERLNNTTQVAKGITPTNTNYIRQDSMLLYSEQIEKAEEAARSFGYASMNELVQKEKQKLEEKLLESSNSVCASITLQFSQTMTLTRQAFRGTLTVFNGHEDTAMSDVKLNLVVKDDEGNIATSHEFQINNESLTDFGGSLNGAWTLEAQKTGVVTVVFIPTKYAALTTPKDYSFGGTLSYIDPFTGLEVTRDLYPVTLTVKPSPNLKLTYFMQRDVLGDDALTLDVVEPIVPAEFSLLIHNVGAGEATNLRMVTQQPKIIDNEKGLFIEFELLSSQLNGGDHTLALGGSVATDFGNIAPQETTYAQWWFTASLLGHFTKYDVEATHITSYGNPDLTLLDEVSIHELIRSIRTPGTGNLTLSGFVVNDIVDGDDLPDRIYLSDGTIEPVAYTTTTGIANSGENEYTLTLTPKAAGWNYGAIQDPTNGRQKLTGIKRVSDNAAIDLRNFWQTDRTLRDGRDPLKENKLHFVDKTGPGNEQYILTFTPRPNTVLQVQAFENQPTEVLDYPLAELTVLFNKNVNADTFTPDDITLICQGDKVDASLITITQVSDNKFTLDLSAATTSDGYYVLTVQTSGITDYEGFTGETGKSVDWNQFAGGQIQFNVKVDPENAGTVNVPSGKYDFGTPLSLVATPNEGYVFEKWTIGGEVQSTEPDFKFYLLTSRTLSANFKRIMYDVTVAYNSDGGNITGGGTGKYEHGTQLVLRAVPSLGYTFAGWIVNGEQIANAVLDVNILSTTTIEALFLRGEHQVEISVAICEGDSYDFYGTLYNKAGTYTYLESGTTEDTLYILKLTVNPRPFAPSITVEGTHTLVSSVLNGNRWYDKDGAIATATGRSFTPSATGLYYVTVTNGDCESEPSETYFVNLSDETKLSWNFDQNWTWISINTSEPTNTKSLIDPIKAKVEQIIGYNSELVNDPEYGLTGGLTTLTAQNSYKLKMKEAAALTLEGSVNTLEDISISLLKGWNWIGYLPVLELSSEVALSNLVAETDDVIKNQTDFSVFDGQNWVGTLTNMKPGEGYMYASVSAKTFTYSPVRASQQKSPALKVSAQDTWELDSHLYPDNMNVIAQLFIEDKIQDTGNFTVGAFYGDECRGIAKQVGDKLFITIHGEKQGEPITFRAIDNATDTEYSINEILTFANEVKGTLDKPVPLIAGELAIKDIAKSAFVVYPNPVKERLFISGINLSLIKDVKVLAVSGNTLLITNNYIQEGIDVSSLSDGIYIVAVSTEEGILYRKFIKSSKLK